MLELVYGQPLWVASTNFWVVRSSINAREVVIVDLPPDPNAVIDFLAREGLKAVAIVATHGHIDHIGGVPTFVEDPSNLDGTMHQRVELKIHRDDAHYVKAPLDNSSSLGQLLVEAGLSTKEPELIEYIDDDVTFGSADVTFKAIHTPGHTPGSTCFLVDLEGYPQLLFSGDHLFKGSIGRTDLEGGSFTKLRDSMVDKILPLSDEVFVLPGHGGTTTIGDERRTNPFIAEFLS
ncbi:MAG: MBL fold metallo-hydrolase [Actinomycetota bacterium]|nr:MBL fold metallo-hydrolase [Actinomycetota bacterium]